MPQLDTSMAMYKLARNMMVWKIHAILSLAVATGSPSLLLAFAACAFSSSSACLAAASKRLT